MNNEYISIISYNASYRDVNAGYQFIDISYITFNMYIKATQKVYIHMVLWDTPTFRVDSFM